MSVAVDRGVVGAATFPVTAPPGCKKTVKVPSAAQPRPLSASRTRRAYGTAKKTVVSLVGAHWFKLAFIGLYYVLFQLVTPIKHPWDTLLSRHVHLLSQAHWDTWRHLFRDGGQGYLAAVAIQFFLYNPYKHSVRRLTSPWRVPLYFLGALVASVPLFVGLGVGVDHLVHAVHTSALNTHVEAHPSLANKLYTSAPKTVVVSFVSGLIGARMLMLPAYDYVLRYFAERRKAAGRGPRWYHTDAYQALLNGIEDTHGAQAQAVAAHRQANRSNWTSRILRGGAFFTTAFFGVGVYVILYVIK